jgi:hypothetical protein
MKTLEKYIPRAARESAALCGSTVRHVHDADYIDQRLLDVHFVVRQRRTLVFQARVIDCDESRCGDRLGIGREFREARSVFGCDTDVANTRGAILRVVGLRDEQTHEFGNEFPSVAETVAGNLGDTTYELLVRATVAVSVQPQNVQRKNASWFVVRHVDDDRLAENGVVVFVDLGRAAFHKPSNVDNGIGHMTDLFALHHGHTPRSCSLTRRQE